MKFNWVLTFFSMLIFFSSQSTAEQTLSLKENTVIDLLFLNDIAGNGQLKKLYFTDVAPIAKAMGYQPIMGFRITKKPIQGNYFPNVLAIAQWPGNMDDRQNLFDQLLVKVPDLHAKRFDIWSSFSMSNYYVSKDRRLTFKDNKRYVLTAFWQSNEKIFQGHLKQYIQQIENAGGKVLIKLSEGSSLFGYLYNPDMTFITEWQDMNAFERFSQTTKVNGKNSSGVKHINEFHLEPIKRKRKPQ